MTDPAVRAASIALAVEVSGWPMDAGLPYHPADKTTADTMQRIAGVAIAAAEPLVKAEAEESLFDALLDDWEYGNCPGSKLKVGNQEIWLYTREDVRLWLRDAQRARREAT